jgi:TonB family protein
LSGARALLIFLASLMVAAPAAADGSTSCAPAPVREGCGTYVWPDGTKYVGIFHGAHFETGVLKFADGSELSLGDSDGRGDARYATADGKVYAGRYEPAQTDLTKPRPPIDFPFWRGFFGDQAVIIVRLVIDEKGNVTSAQLDNRTGKSFDDSVLNGVKAWHFVPATVDGHPVEGEVTTQVDFSNPHS